MVVSAGKTSYHCFYDMHVSKTAACMHITGYTLWYFYQTPFPQARDVLLQSHQRQQCGKLWQQKLSTLYTMPHEAVDSLSLQIRTVKSKPRLRTALCSIVQYNRLTKVVKETHFEVDCFVGHHMYTITTLRNGADRNALTDTNSTLILRNGTDTKYE